MHVVEQDVLFYLSRLDLCVFFHCSLEVVYFFWPCFNLSPFHTC